MQPDSRLETFHITLCGHVLSSHMIAVQWRLVVNFHLPLHQQSARPAGSYILSLIPQSNRSVRTMMMCVTTNAQAILASRSPACSTPRQQSSRSLYGQIGRHRLSNGVRPSSRSSARRSHTLHVVSAMPVGEVAVLPSLIPVLLRAFSAGLLLYSSLQWASARSDRKQVRDLNAICSMQDHKLHGSC